jgi:hypothetical protein
VRGLLARFGRIVRGMPIPRITMRDLPVGIVGVWSQWEIKMRSTDAEKGRLCPLFLHEDGRCLPPTARFLFDQLASSQWTCIEILPTDASEAIFDRVREAAGEQLRDTYLDIKSRHLNRVSLEEEKAEYSYRVRRKLIDAVGLPEVREYRQRQLAAEQVESNRRFAEARETLPELHAVQILEILPL